MKLLQKSLMGAALILLAGQLYAQPATGADPQLANKMIELDKQVQGDLAHIISLQAIARKQQDVIKLSCVNDRYMRAKAGANIFDNARIQITGVDQDARATAMVNVRGATDTVHQAREEADRCVGSTEIQSDSNSSYTHPDVPDDPTVGGTNFGGNQVIEPPTYATPFH